MAMPTTKTKDLRGMSDEQLVAAQTAFVAALSLAELDVRGDSPSKDEIELCRTLVSRVDATVRAASPFKN